MIDIKSILCSYFLLLAIQRILNLISFSCHLKAQHLQYLQFVPQHTNQNRPSLFAICPFSCKASFEDDHLLITGLLFSRNQLSQLKKSFEVRQERLFIFPNIFCYALSNHNTVSFNKKSLSKSSNQEKLILAHICTRSRNI